MEKNNAGENDNRKGSPPAKTRKKVIKQLVTRGFTILVLAPTVFYLISVSRMAMVAIVYAVICFCSFEWSGVKRHLKVSVLLAKNHSLHTSVDALEFSEGAVENAPPPPHPEDGEWKWRSLATEHRLEKNILEDSPLWVSDTEKAEDDLRKVPHTPVMWPSQVVSLASTTEGREGEGTKGSAERAVGSEDTPFLNASVKEFAYPVPTLTIYNVCKHLSWANLAIAASHGSLAFLLLFSAYFLIFVGVTIIAHNRLEFKVEEAMDRLLEMRAMSTLRFSASELISGRGSFLSGASSSSCVLSPVLDTKNQKEGKDPQFLEAQADYLEPIESKGSSGGGKEDTTMRKKGNERGSLPSAPFLEEEDHTASTMRRRGVAEKRVGNNDHRSNALVERASFPRQEEKEEEGERGAAATSNSPHAMRYIPGIPDTCKSVSLPLPPSLFPSFSLSGFFNREKDQQENARKEQARFARLELSVIVENQPAEQFVDFCLDIFGCVWISLFATVIMVYDIPFLGFPWVCAALAGNFSNDIMALVVGMTVKTIKGRFFSHLKDVQGHESRGRGDTRSARRRTSTNAIRNGKPRLGRPREERRSESPDPRKSNGTSPRMGERRKENDPVRSEERAGEAHPAEETAEGKRHPLSTTTTKVPLERSLRAATHRSWWSDVEDFMARAPHPLYLSISPNKSVEGALAGVLTNTIVFVLVLSLWPWGDTAYSSVDHSYYYRYDTTHHPKTAPADMDAFTGLRGSTALAFSCPSTLHGAEDWPLPSSCVRVPRYHCFSAWVVAGFIMGVAGVVGDLLQSLLKRASRVKDTGSLLPGHGGMLDRVDGLLLSFPTLFFLVYVVIALG